MNYNSEPLMSWIMYVKNGVWEVVTPTDCAGDPESIIDLYEELIKNEFVRECNEAVHSMFNVYKRFGPISVVINPERMTYSVYDNYNNLMRIYNGIFMEFDGLKLCLDTKAHGFPNVGNRYFKYSKEEDDRYVSLKSIVEGTSKNGSQNVRRMISILFTRFFQYIESTNPEQKVFMDYTDEEKEQILKECINYDGKPRGKKGGGNPDEE